MTRPWVRRACAAVVALCLSGCAARAVNDPLSVMLDRTRDPAQRLVAAKQLGTIRDAPDPTTLASAWHRVLWPDNQPTDLRLLAMDRLIEYDEQAFWHVAERRILDTDLWPVRGPLIQKAIERGDPSFIPALVRSYTRDSQVYVDADRPERAAILALAPGKTIQRAVRDVLVSDDVSVTTAGRVDAWELLNRLSGTERARELLFQTRSAQPVILDLQAADWLSVLPTNRESVLWLMRVRGENGGLFWEQAKRPAGRLTDDQRRGLALRHLSALLLVEESDLQRDTAKSMSRLASLLSGASHTRRVLVGIMRELPSESLADHGEQLCWADLLVIGKLVDALRDRALVAELFRQADADHADTASEHGGVIALENDRYTAIDFPPVLRAHDQKFYASDALIQRMYTGLVHYHFHAHQYANAEYAGPGPGDLGFVEHLRAGAVVFTFLDRDTLGVDYYQPGGVIVDLGVIKR
jgi:hypothetical protein